MFQNKGIFVSSSFRQLLLKLSSGLILLRTFRIETTYDKNVISDRNLGHWHAMGKRLYTIVNIELIASLQWRHNEHDGVLNHQPHVGLLNRLCRRRSKNITKLLVTGLWWRHHFLYYITKYWCMCTLFVYTYTILLVRSMAHFPLCQFVLNSYIHNTNKCT